jgi:apolipoprotein N-acyltransferase
VWVAFELCRDHLFTGFPWGNLGYTQARHLLVAQLAALAGPYGIAFLVVLVNAALHALVRARLDGARPPWRLAAATAAVAAAAVGFGAVHLAGVRARAAAAPKLQVALVQGNINQSVKNEHATHGDWILGRYLPLTREADRAGADLVAWPEATFPWLVPPDIARFSTPRAPMPALSRAHLLLGAATYRERLEGGRRVAEGANTAFLTRPDLSVVDGYAKHHLVPFGEYVPLPGLLGGVLRSVVPDMIQQRNGSALKVLAFPAPEGGPEVRLAPMICFDAIFPEIGVAFAAQDPELIVNPTNDAWYGYSSGPYQFLAMVRLRAIEAGKAVARPAYAGVSALIAPTGEVLPGALPVGPVDPDLAPDPDEPPRLLMGALPRLRGRTPYTKVGDLFAGVASLGAAAALAAALARRRGAPPA